MKCPYCKIHYMDDARECPMCGKRNLRYKLGGTWETNQTSKKQAETPTKHARAERKQVKTRPAQSQQKKSGSPTGKQKKNGLGWISTLIAILMVVLPTVFSVVEDLSSDFFEDGIEFVVSQGNAPVASEEDLMQHALERLDGTWECKETGEILTFDMDSFAYALLDQENGWIDITESRMQEEDNQIVYLYEITFYPEEQDAYPVFVRCTEEVSVLFTVRNTETGQTETKLWERKETD